MEKYSDLKDYLAAQLNSIIELEPTYNELKAVREIKNKNWDLVFAPPGLAAIAISQSQYTPIFPLEGGQKTRSVIVVLQDNPIAKLPELAGKAIALGQPGSATGYYLPIYNLYGLTLASVRFASLPKMVLELIARGEVAAGGISLADFYRYRSDFPNTKFRILYTDSHNIPSGAILVAPTVDRNQEILIRKVLADAPGAIAASAGYISNAPVPDYQDLIDIVTRVGPIAQQIKQKPAHLYE